VNQPARQQQKFSAPVLAAGAVGNLLEWYDFGLYGLLAPVLAPLFFPAQDRIAGLIGAYAAFAIGFAVRPIGGAVLGHLGDRYGRRVVLLYSIVMMGVGTTAVAALPTYQEAGIGASILLLLVRVIQGFSVGGEFTSSVAYLVETAPPQRRGIAGSVANIGSTGGMLLAAAAAAITTTLADPAQLATFAWRVPFLLGGLVAVCGFFLRSHVREEGFKPRRSADNTLPIRQAINEAPRILLLAVMFACGYGIVDYLTMVFLPAYASEFGGLSTGRALQVNTAAQMLALFIVPCSGWLTDRLVARRTLLLAAFIGEFVVASGCFTLAAHGGPAGYWVAQMVFGALLALVMGSEPAMMTELFRSEYRLSGYSVSFNIGIGIAGGTAPMIAAALIAATGNTSAAGWYLMAGSALAVGALFMLPDRSRDPLR
jgi:MHS family proline/betaine transporter-like MFS transporter